MHSGPSEGDEGGVCKYDFMQQGNVDTIQNNLYFACKETEESH